MIVEEHNKGCGGTKQKFIRKLAVEISKASNLNGRTSMIGVIAFSSNHSNLVVVEPLNEPLEPGSYRMCTIHESVRPVSC